MDIVIVTDHAPIAELYFEERSIEYTKCPHDQFPLTLYTVQGENSLAWILAGGPEELYQRLGYNRRD
jgi:hypothetical protein